MTTRGVTLAFATCLPLLTSVFALRANGAALDEAKRCESAKLVAAGKYAACRLKAEGKAVRTGAPVDVSRCNATVAREWGQIESISAGACPAGGELSAVQTLLTECSIDVPGGSTPPTVPCGEPFVAALPIDPATAEPQTLLAASPAAGTMELTISGVMCFDRQSNCGITLDYDNRLTPAPAAHAQHLLLNGVHREPVEGAGNPTGDHVYHVRMNVDLGDPVVAQVLDSAYHDNIWPLQVDAAMVCSSTTTTTTTSTTSTTIPGLAGAYTCKTYHDAIPTLPDGAYLVDPDGTGGIPPFDAWCDMSNDGGGWTLLITFAKLQTPFATVSEWPSAIAVTGGEPLTSGMYKGVMGAFSEVREEVNSGANKVYAKNLSETALEDLRQYYAYTDRAGVIGGFPPCRKHYDDPLDDISRCAAYSASATAIPVTHLGFQWDVWTSWCWFSRGTFDSGRQGSALCIGGSGGEPNGTAWARVFFR